MAPPRVEKEDVRDVTTAPAATAVLVVEDDEAVREAILTLLESEGYAPMGAPNGAEALRLLQQSGELPAVLVVDLWMPVMNGWQLCSALAAHERLQALPIVVLTADVRSQGQPLPGRVVRALTKPVDPDDLLAAVAAGARTAHSE